MYFCARLGDRDGERLEKDDFELERERELRLFDEYELWLEREDLLLKFNKFDFNGRGFIGFIRIKSP